MTSGPIGIGSRLCSAGTPAVSCGRTIYRSEVRLIPNRIRKVLSTMANHQVRALLMGGQACVFYGAAEFSRDTDLLILADAANLERLEAALQDLQARLIAVPPLSLDYLKQGHAVHFRCHHPEAKEIRIDVMSRLRGVDEFEVLWTRRTTLRDEDGAVYELLSLPDLVQAKKTQRSKDWPMLQRLLEAHYLQHRSDATLEQRRFWLHELRTPELLAEATQRWPELAEKIARLRPLLLLAKAEQLDRLREALLAEEQTERQYDRTYWQPLKAELERLRHSVRTESKTDRKQE
ncbi:MAG: hypothetical protein JXM79_19650 [Sedimentisphaerales bacterium]|nr:hypothetical protein [Sedimentisphaerales bacterium]